MVKIKIKTKKSKKNVNKNAKSNNRIEPLFWVLPNKKIFPKWINETFIRYKAQPVANSKRKIEKGIFEPFGYQLFLRDLMQSSSPYRGILLYHGLGSGKTCSSILIAENLKENSIVILPASLRDNFIREGLQFCGNPKYKTDPILIKDKYYFISSNASNTIQQLNKIGSLDNHTIVIDEEHNLVSRIVGGLSGDNKQGRQIYEKLMEARNCKIIALSGTPIINEPYELAILCNILRGYIYITYFKIAEVSEKYGKIWKTEQLRDILTKDIKYVDYVEVNQRAQTVEAHLMLKPYDIEFPKLITAIIERGKENGVMMEYDRFDRFTLFPDASNGEGEREFDRLFIDQQKNTIKNRDVFQRRILGLISYYKSRTENFPDLRGIELLRLPMSDYQFTEYMKVRAEEKTSRKLSEIRIFSRQYSNFVFPVGIPRPGIGEKIFQAVEENEEDIVKKEELREYYKSVDVAMQKLVANADVYLKKDLEIYSPKMKRILEIAEPEKGLVFVYSAFRSLEGIEIFAKILEANGYTVYNGKQEEGKHYALYTGKEDSRERTEALQAFNHESNRYGKYIKYILVTSAGAEGLDLKNVRQVHIMEPYWNETKIKQIIGRAIRRNSHIDLPEKERNVMVYRYFAIIPESKKKELKAKDRESTDEVIFELAKRKEAITNEMLECARESSVDCLLNYNEETIKCYDFAERDGLSYQAQLSRNLGVGLEEATRTKEVVLRKGFIGKDGRIYYVDSRKVYLATDKAMSKEIRPIPEIEKKVVIDLDKKILYDYDIAVSKQTKVKVGNYN